MGYGIKIDNYKGSINITLDKSAKINSEDGYGIYITNCSGDIRITLQSGSTIMGSNYGIYLKNCTNASITYTGESSISGDNGDVFIESSTAVINNTRYTTDGAISL